MEATLFDFPNLEITNKIRLIELFGGIGSQAMALRDIGADFEHYRLVEFDKYAVASYNAIHHTAFETSDIRNVHGADLGIVDKSSYTYLLTYSFPCTDLSVAGKMQGMSKSEWEQGKSTRSGLLWEVERILKELPDDQLPQVLLMENVPQVHSEQNMGDFEAWLAFLRSRGYFNFYQDLNAKDYGIPQNRDRCFCVSILSPEFIDYEFPEGVKLKKVMKDFLEEEVEEKYYFNNPKAEGIIDLIEKKGQLEVKDMEGVDLSTNCTGLKTICATICARYDAGIINHSNLNTGVIECKEVMIKQATKEGTISERQNSIKAKRLPNGNIRFYRDDEKKSAVSELQVQSGADVAQTITVANVPKIYKEEQVEIKQATKEGTIKCKVGGCYDASFPGSATRRGRVQEGGDVVPTLTAGSNENIRYIETIYRIRKLTPRECWRLMGYTDADFDRASQVNSNTQLYKQAGNAIVKQVLMAIFAQMLPKAESKAISA